MEDFTDGGDDVRPRDAITHRNVGGTEDHAIDELPDVEVMDGSDTVEVQDFLANVNDAHLLRGALKEDPDTTDDDGEGSVENESDDQQGGDGI